MVRLHGELFRRLVPLLDGTRTHQQIVSELAADFQPALVHFGLAELQRGGHLRNGSQVGAADPDVVAYWDARGLEYQNVADALAAHAVDVVTLGRLPEHRLEHLLAESGIRVVASSWPKVVLVDDYLHEGLAAIDGEARRSGGSWLLARPVGSVAWLGPWFGPHTACWHCLAHRLRGHRPIESLAARHNGDRTLYRPLRGATPATLHASVGLLASIILRRLAGGGDAQDDKLTVIDPLMASAQEHVVVRRPQCPACGDPALMAQQQRRALDLIAHDKRFAADGGHRTVAPEETFRRYQRHVSPITGVVQKLQQILTTPDEIAPVFDAGHNLARRGDSLLGMKQIFRSRSAGKGATTVQARASGLCEALERYSAVFQGDEARQTASFRDMGKSAIHPASHLLFSARQYAERATLNRNQRKRSYTVPEPFDENTPVEWSPAWSLTDKQLKFVATAACYYGYEPAAPSPPFCWADSNGCAAGNVIEEAILQGFLELVERDAVAIWWYNRVRRPAVDLSSFEEPYLARLLRHYADLGRTVWALDVTADLPIPTFVAVSRQNSGPAENITIGFGCHFDPRIAILRAVTEMNQFLPALSDGSSVIVSDEDVQRWLEQETIAAQPYLMPAEQPARQAADYCAHGGNLLDDVNMCVELARGLDVQLLVHDMSRPDIGLPVVKVIAPGLRHFWPRFAPGRLYDVPVRLGWLREPTREQDLNPLPVFF